MIIVGGYNVYPREIDELLFKHPAILEAVAIGVPDSFSGEAVKAFVVLRPGATLTAEELQDYCRAVARQIQGADQGRVRRCAAALGRRQDQQAGIEEAGVDFQLVSAPGSVGAGLTSMILRSEFERAADLKYLAVRILPADRHGFRVVCDRLSSLRRSPRARRRRRRCDWRAASANAASALRAELIVEPVSIATGSPRRRRPVIESRALLAASSLSFSLALPSETTAHRRANFSDIRRTPARGDMLIRPEQITTAWRKIVALANKA